MVSLRMPRGLVYFLDSTSLCFEWASFCFGFWSWRIHRTGFPRIRRSGVFEAATRIVDEFLNWYSKVCCFVVSSYFGNFIV